VRPEDINKRNNPDLTIIIYTNNKTKEIDEKKTIKLNRNNESKTEDIIFKKGVKKKDDQENNEENNNKEDDKKGDKKGDKKDDNKKNDKKGDKKKNDNKGDNKNFGREINFIK